MFNPASLPEHHLEIADQGRVHIVDLAAVQAFHGGEAIFGINVAFRMLQYAARYFSSEDEVWDRSNLTVRSAHPGPGVRDTIECVTRCVSRGGFAVDDSATACHSAMRFEWRLQHGRETLQLRLREDFIPQRFRDLLDLKNSGKAVAADRQALQAMKLSMSRALWDEPLETLFISTLPEQDRAQ